jgi:hypothetical protein
MNNSDIDYSLKIGNRVVIVEDTIDGKKLANVRLNEIVTITSISKDYKILYHSNSLALPNNKKIFKKIWQQC